MIINMRLSIIVCCTILFFTACKDTFLNEEPVGELTESQIQDSTNVEGLVTSAYSVLNGQFDNASNAYNSPASNWSFGDVVSDDAYKGGGGTGDQNNIHQMEIFNDNSTTKDIERKWLALYEGIRRANEAIKELQTSNDISQHLKDERIAEMHFLRGHFFFELKKIYNRIPWIDASATKPEDYVVANDQYTSDELWDKIAEEFNQASQMLPDEQKDPGRPTRLAARAYMCKVYIFQGKWQKASDLADEVISSNKYHLMNNFRDVFLPENDNGPEIIFAVQHSINDGSPNNYNGSIGDRLAAPGGPYYPQYGFHRPSQDLINAFHTNINGLPVNDHNDITLSDNVDPRLDHTVARPGIPYLDLGIKYDQSWARDLATYGPYSPKKRMVSAKSDHYLKVWPYVNDLNYYVIRYADVLLWKAEAAIQLGDLETGRQFINKIRERAKNSKTVKTLDGSQDAAPYLIDTYNQPFPSKQEAFQALHIERRLEFAQEGHRFFDLVRWGIADQVMNAFIQREQDKRQYLRGAHFEKGKNEFFPIPQSQIDLSQGKIKQNPKYN